MLRDALNQMHTLRDLLRLAVSRFNQAQLHFGHGSNDVFDEAAYLILHTLHLPIDRLEPFLDARLTSDEVLAVLEVLEKRIELRLPAAYITHEAWLGEYRFYVDERVLIPRSYIAELLREQVLEHWIAADQVDTALDLCTGSGCLAILLAEAYPMAKVDAGDISSDALDVAMLNVAEYRLEDRLELIQTDVFSKLSGRRYDVIVSNPPYVNDYSMNNLPPEFHHEPALGLAGGDDGLRLVRAIIQDAAEHLTDQGILVLEIGHNRPVLEEAFPQTPFTWLDTSGGDQFVCLLTRDDCLAADPAG